MKIKTILNMIGFSFFLSFLLFCVVSMVYMFLDQLHDAGLLSYFMALFTIVLIVMFVTSFKTLKSTRSLDEDCSKDDNEGEDKE